MTTYCGLGTYRPAGGSSCAPCPVGHECSPSLATACPAGMYAELGKGYCWAKPAGIASISIVGATVTLTPCLPGSFKPIGEGECLVCPKAHKCPEPTLPPVKCPPGTYQDQEGQASCKVCTNTYSIGGQEACLACPPGFACPSLRKCPMGTWANAEAGQRSCAPCSDGYLCQSGSGTPTPANSRCPAGFFCASDPVSGVLLVTPCSVGSYNPLRGSSQASACLSCPAGFFCPLGASTPLACPSGSACLEATEAAAQSLASPSPCPAGSYLLTKGATALATCQECPATYYCPELTTYPVKCPPGYYCPAGTKEGKLLPCLAGTYGGLDSLSAAA